MIPFYYLDFLFKKIIFFKVSVLYFKRNTILDCYQKSYIKQQTVCVKRLVIAKIYLFRQNVIFEAQILILVAIIEARSNVNNFH